MVKIQEDDTFWIEDEQYFSDQDLRIRIRQATAESGGKPLALIVVGNSDASYDAAIRVIDAGADAQVGSVSLLVQEVTDDCSLKRQRRNPRCSFACASGFNVGNDDDESWKGIIRHNFA